MPETGSAYQYTVITVDDDPVMLDVVGRYLTGRGLRVLQTTDPENVIPLALKEKPRLIISDIAMPGLDGLTLLTRLKENTETANIPVILLTSSKDPADMERGLDTGAEAYLVKPIDWDQCWPKIQAIIMRS